MIYKNEYENCIHFDGKECRNEESCNYGSYGEFCVDCKDVEGVDNMNKDKKEGDIIVEEIKNMMNNATDEQKLQIAQLHKNLTDGIVANTFVYDTKEKIEESIATRLQERTPSIIKINIHYNDAPYILYDDNDEFRAHSWNNFIKILTEDIFTFYSTEMIKEEYYDNIKAIIDIEKQVVKQEIKMIKSIMEVIDNISEETNDEIWDMGVIETGYEIYTTLEIECQKIINELNIDFNVMEYGTPVESIPKAIELIEKEIL